LVLSAYAAVTHKHTEIAIDIAARLFNTLRNLPATVATITPLMQSFMIGSFGFLI